MSAPMTSLEVAVRHVLLRMHGCPDPDCLACLENHTTVVALVSQARLRPAETMDGPRVRELAR